MSQRDGPAPGTAGGALAPAGSARHWENGYAARPVGVYVHFPWCLAKCPYCDFLSIATDRNAIPHDVYADAVIRELEVRAPELESAAVHSVFFGGGTPSLWATNELGRVLARLQDALGLAGDVEITVECNPTSLDYDKARALLEVGVNRLSVGVQGLDAERLRFLGRLHDPEQAISALRAAIASGMERVSADLIFGVAGQTVEQASNEAATIAAEGVGHVSAYALTIEPGTQFGALARKGRLPLLADDVVADSFLAIDERLQSFGLAHYEISNYAKPGQRAEHNLGYWTGRNYVGLGCAAWGTLDTGGRRVRYRNTPSIERYLASPGSALSDTETLSPETALSERILLGLRLEEGVDLEEAGRALGVEPWSDERWRTAARLEREGKLTREAGRIRIPKQSWLLADGIIAQLL
jgi:putative oxygen-independent coproporphyrinogen III oxidase